MADTLPVLANESRIVDSRVRQALLTERVLRETEGDRCDLCRVVLTHLPSTHLPLLAA